MPGAITLVRSCIGSSPVCAFPSTCDNHALVFPWTRTMSQAADLRFVQLGALALRIYRLDPEAVCGELARRREQAPELLSEAALLLDLDRVTEVNADGLRELVSGLRQQEFPIAGLIASPTASEHAGALDLPVVGRATEARPDHPGRERQARQQVANTGHTRHVDGPVRSGQQIYAKGGDLVVVGNVGAGAEVIADGSVHVYGSLRGRALAGAQGNEEARVFSTDFLAELVSVSGTYKVFEELPRNLRGKAIQVRLDAGQLQMAPLSDR